MEKYTSTLLPQDNTPQENQKAVLDLLKKTNQVHDDAVSGINAAKAELQKQINGITAKLVGYVFCLGNPATAANTVIQYTEIADSLNCYSAGVFTFPKDGIALLNATYFEVSGGALYVGKNATLQYAVLQSETGAIFGGAGVLIPGVAGDTLYANTNNGARVATNTSLSILFMEL